MAIARGQVDRFGNPIPANQAYKIIINSDGSVLRQREILTLDATITATDNDITGSTDLSAAAAETGITALTGDVTATGPGSSVATISNLAVTSGKIAVGAVGTAQLADTAVTPGLYTNMSATVDADGRLTAASSGTAPVTSVTGTSPITSSGGVTPAIGISNSGNTVGRANLTVLLARATPSAVSTALTASWLAGAYKKILIDFWGRFNGYLEIQVNGDTGNNYSDYGASFNANVIAGDTAVKGTNAFARVAVTGTATSSCYMECEFAPITTGFERPGWSRSTSIDAGGAINTAAIRTTGWCWHNSANDVTSISIFPLSGQTWTGTVEIYGIPA